MMKLSVVIAALNQETPIGRAIQQFWSPGVDVPVEVVVVDAGSSDGTCGVARLLADRVVEVASPQEGWRAAARNAGAAAAQGDVILFLDAEARIATSLEVVLGRLQAIFGDAGRAACVLPQLEAQDAADEAIAAIPRKAGFLLAVRRSGFLECGGFPVAAGADEDAELLALMGLCGVVGPLEEVHFSAVPAAEVAEIAA
jgi:glycosyltransferase involved in cell wall biosynthesis